MTGLLLAAILAPLAASIASLITGWRRTTATLTALSATTVLACAVAMGFWMGSGAQFGLGGLLRADALTVVMLVVIGIVGTLATAASIGYIDTELAHGHIDGRSARLYGVLTPAFLCAMVLAVCANNIGVIWVAIEATTVITAFLVGHRRTRTALEATWKYVVICSVGIAVAFLGTVLLYFAARDSGAAAAGALNLDILAEHAAGLDPGVARLAGGLLLIGYGAKAGLFPFHTWLADAHSQAPAPVSALMSGVLLAVAFSVLIRLRPILDAVSGPAYLRNGLLVVGLATLLVAVLMLTVTGDVKRMLAYSSMEHMGLIAIAAAAGTTLAIAALLLHALAHSLAIEDALGIELPHEVHRLRALIVELERLYNHAADLGALANDVGYSLANAHAQRIRENLLRRNAAVTGHRLLRGAIRAGGVALRALPDTDELAALAVDLAEVATLTLANSVVYDRFAGTAVLHPDDASALGCLGYVARASGLRSDARVEHPTIVLPITEIGAPDGDVLARYTVRRDEFAASAALAQHIVESHTGPIEYAATLHPVGAPSSGIGIVEGWRGTIVHRVEIDVDGRITRAKVVDPSWFNWPALPVAMADTIVPDFPLANKSFNQSYAGNDL